MDNLLKEILKSPRLYEYAKVIQQTIETEKQKRQRFYNEITEQQKAEFIEGEIICHSPVKIEHNIVGKHLLLLLQTYVTKNKLGFVGYEKILVRLTRNDFEPDICFFNKEKSDKFVKNQMFFPAPNFVAEIISESTEKRDRGIKFEDYAIHGVKEYWIIDPENKFIEQYTLYEQRFEIIQKITSGKIRSLEIEGFEIPVMAIFDEEENYKTLQKLLKS